MLDNICAARPGRAAIAFSGGNGGHRWPGCRVWVP